MFHIYLKNIYLKVPNIRKFLIIQIWDGTEAGALVLKTPGNINKSLREEQVQKKHYLIPSPAQCFLYSAERNISTSPKTNNLLADADFLRKELQILDRKFKILNSFCLYRIYRSAFFH